MAGMFTVTMPDFKKLMYELEKTLRLSVAATVNDCAFEFRRDAMEAMSDKMTVRSPGFLKKALKVGTKAKWSQDIGDMAAEAGSLELPGFTGWIEQLGGPNKRERTATLFSRDGVKTNVINARNRYHKNAHYVSSDDFSGLPEKRRIAAAIRTASRKGPQARMILRGAGFPHGLYAPTGRTTAGGLPEVRAVRLFDRPPADAARFDWIEAALEKMGPDFFRKSLAKNAAYYMRKNGAGK